MQTAALTVPAEFLRLEAAAAFMGISRPHLQNLMKKGQAPPSIRLGRARLFSVQTLRTFLCEREQ
jgi:predicted DNA-binding transcriptional regulator AlpA